MTRNNNIDKNKKTTRTMMKKIIPIIFILLFLITPTQAIFGLFEEPLTATDMITLHTIYENANGQAYGFNGTNSTCSPIHFQTPYKQVYDRTYIRLGYVPICDVNQSDYGDHYVSLFCEGSLVNSWNFTENCADLGVVYQSELIELNLENTTAGVFQTDTLSSLFSCMICVNDTGSDLPNRTDFWIRAENTGNQVTLIVQNETAIEGLEPITETLILAVEVTKKVLEILVISLEIFAIVWAIFFPVLLLLFWLIRIRMRFKDATRAMRK